MVVLSEQQVTFILDDIRRNGIELEELQYSLLDHVCCIIENEMQPDEPFEEFYRKTIPRFFKRDLGEIQEETNLVLTFKNYYAMKKTMLISGAIAALGVVAGSFFKVMHWPGASALFLLSVFVLCFIFLPILFVIKTREVKAKREKIILGIATLLGILFSVSTLFKVMHWPCARVLWFVSLGILLFIFLPIYFFGGIRNPETKTNTIVSSVLILFAGGMLFLLTTLRPSLQMHHLKAHSIEEIDKLYQFETKQNALKYAILANDSTKSQADLVLLRTTCDSLCAQLDALTKEVIDIASAGQNPKPNFEKLLSDYDGNYDLPSGVLFDHNGVTNPKLVAVKQGIEKLKTLSKEKFYLDNSSTLNIGDVDTYPNATGEKISWERATFYNVPFELGMLNLNELKLNVRMVESACL